MALPRILYDLAPIVNPSFETGADATRPPTGWSTDFAQDAEELCEIDTAQYHVRGSSEGVKSARIWYDAASLVGTYMRQGVTWKPPVGTPIAFVGLARYGSADFGTDMHVREMNGSTVLASSSIEFVPSSANAWLPFSVTRTLNQVTADGIRVEFNDFAGLSGGAGNFHESWYDYLHLGRRLDFPWMPFDSLELEVEQPRQINRGGGAIERVRVADRATRMRLNIPRVSRDTVATSLDTELQDFIGWVEGYKRFAFWMDRDDHTNRGLHFSNCNLVDVYRMQEGIGPRAYKTVLEFEAGLEWPAQAVV